MDPLGFPASSRNRDQTLVSPPSKQPFYTGGMICRIFHRPSKCNPAPSRGIAAWRRPVLQSYSLKTVPITSGSSQYSVALIRSLRYQRVRLSDVAESLTATPVATTMLDSPRAWRMAGTAFVSCFTVYGVMYSFGAFLKPIAAEFSADRAATSVIFSLTATVYSILGLFAGRISDRLGPRRVLLGGACALAAGLILTGSVHSLAAIYVVYGLGVGLGIACGYVPMLAVVGGWFERYRNAAMGVAVAGIGAGTLAVSPLAALLIDHFGWRAAYRILGGASGVVMLLCAMVAEAPPRPATNAPFRFTSYFRSSAFVRLYISSLLVSIPVYIPFVYLVGFAETRGIGEVPAAALVGFIGAASLIGRLGFGPLANRIGGNLPMYRLNLLIMAASYLIWPFAFSYPTFVLFTIVMGSSYGGMVALSPAVVADLFGVDGLGTTIGALYTSFSISALTGPPLVGFAIDHGGFMWAAAIAGVTALGGFAMLFRLSSQRN